MDTETDTTRTMNKSLVILAIAVAGLVAFPRAAEAGHARISFTYQSGRASCGCPVRWKRQLHRYGRHRLPVYRYVRIPIVHRCRIHAHPPVHYRHINRGRHPAHYYQHSRYYRPAPRHGYRPGYGYSRACR